MNHGFMNADIWAPVRQLQRGVQSISAYVDDDCVEGYDLHSMLRIIVDNIRGEHGVSNLKTRSI